MARLPCKGIWPPSRFSIGYGPWKPQFKIENQIFLLDLPKIITFCPKTVLFYILDVFRAHLKSPFWIQKVVSLPILAYFCFNFGLFSPRYASTFSMRCILTHKSFLPKIVIFLLPGGVHCAVFSMPKNSSNHLLVKHFPHNIVKRLIWSSVYILWMKCISKLHET